LEDAAHLYDLLSGFDTAMLVTRSADGHLRARPMHGRVNVVREAALIERLWRDSWKTWFPRGKSDPSIALLRFDAEHGEFWNDSSARGVRYAFEATKAYMTGESPSADSRPQGRPRH
jgi:general stress protein 26